MTKSFARTFGQDLMRGEHVVGGGSSTRPGGSGNAPGRTFRQHNAGGDAWAGKDEQTGTSIFDPVLCELAYRWFSAKGGVVLDPFAVEVFAASWQRSWAASMSAWSFVPSR